MIKEAVDALGKLRLVAEMGRHRGGYGRGQDNVRGSRQTID